MVPTSMFELLALALGLAGLGRARCFFLDDAALDITAVGFSWAVAVLVGHVFLDEPYL